VRKKEKKENRKNYVSETHKEMKGKKIQQEIGNFVGVMFAFHYAESRRRY
jgi:hypothetical protein